MATIDTIADRSTGTAVAGKMYFETSTNKLIAYNGSVWIELDSDGTGADVFENLTAVSLDGTDDYCGASVNRLNGASWSSTTPFSQSAWVKSLSFATNDGVFGMGRGNSGGSLNPSFAGGNGGIHQQGGTATSGGYYLWLSATKYSLSGTFNVGDWHHIAWTWDGSNGVVYVDGTQNITFTDTSNGYAWPGTPFNVYVGVSRWAYNYGECLVDEFATWDSALTASDITTLYNSGAPADISSLSPLAWYRMGDGTEAGSGNASYDMSGNSQGNLNLYNGATFQPDVP